VSHNKELTLSEFFHSCENKSTSLYQDFVFLLVEKIGKDHTSLISGSELLSEKDQKFLKKWQSKKLEDYPIQYFVNQVEFCGLKLHIEEGALIPRMETEEMLLKAFELVKKHSLNIESIMDVGTGSGCLGVTAGYKLKDSLKKVVLLEPSKEALKSLEKNIELYGDSRFEVFNQAFETTNFSESFDLILSNPPYIEPGDPEVQNSVYQYEPHIALYGGDKPVDLIVLWVNKAYDLLNKGGLMLFEFSHDQRSALSSRLSAFNPVFYKDSFGKDRYLSIFK